MRAEPYLISSADPATTLSTVGTTSLILSVGTATYPRCAHSDVGAFGKDTAYRYIGAHAGVAF